MKINKSIIIGSILLGIIGLLLIIAQFNQIVESIGISLLAGAIVSVVTSYLYYAYERQTILKKIKTLLPEMYIHLSVIMNITGYIILQVTDAPLLSALKFDLQTKLAEEAITVLNEYHEGVYSGFIHNCKDSRKVNEFEKFIPELRGLKYNLKRLELYAADTDNYGYQLRIKQMNGQVLLPEEEKLYRGKRELVTVQLAKAHEYEASLLKKIDEMAEYNYDGRKENWIQMKDLLNSEVNMIMKEAEL